MRQNIVEVDKHNWKRVSRELISGKFLEFKIHFLFFDSNFISFRKFEKVLKSKKAADQPQKLESKQIYSKNSESTSENSNASSSKTKASESAEATEAKQAKINDHIKKLETRLRRINRKIKELEEDSDWSDGNDENSPYILEDKYKKKAVQIHKKIQEYRQVLKFSN